MKHCIYVAFLCYFFLFIPNKTNAQLLPANQPEQDACGAIMLCGNSFFTPYGYQSTGTVNDMINTPCGSGEASSMWLKVVVVSPGSIVFTITPVVGTDDYDFAVIDATNVNCGSINSSNVVRCNFNNNQQPNSYYADGIVGVNGTTTPTNVMSGANGQPFCQQINADAGDVYLIMINNYGADNCYGSCPGSGFTIDFTGSTATFQSQGQPIIDSVGYACEHVSGMQLFLSQQINCSSVASDHSDFYLTPTGNISSVIGDNCNSNGQGYSSTVSLTFNPPLAPGTYTLHPQIGTDGNTLLNLCNGALSTDDTIQFTIYPYPKLASAQLICSTIVLTLSSPVLCNSLTSTGSEFQIISTDPISIVSATPVNCNSQGYTNTINLTISGSLTSVGGFTIKAQNGTDGNTLEGNCTKMEPIGDSISVLANPLLIHIAHQLNAICTANNGKADIIATGGNAPYNYSLNNTSSWANNNEFQNLAPGNYVVFVKDNLGCETSDTFSILHETHTLSFEVDTVSAVCDNNHLSGSIKILPSYTNTYIGALPYTFLWNGYTTTTTNVLDNIAAGTYSVLVTDANGCTGDTTVSIGELPCCHLMLPSAFSPNSDGVNDMFKPVSNVDIIGYHISIYNRWGQMVFESNDALLGWNGECNNIKANSGVYYYYLSYTCNRSQQRYKSKGSVTLVR